MGGLDPIYTFERGNADTVQRAVEELHAQALNGRGLIVGTAEAFGPETSLNAFMPYPQAVRTCFRG